MQLTLDHVILRAADPAAALAELAEKLAAPVLVPVTEAGPFRSGLIRAGARPRAAASVVSALTGVPANDLYKGITGRDPRR